MTGTRERPCVATPTERRWLERLRKVRWDWGRRVVLTHRNSDRDWDFGNLLLVMHRYADGSVRYGSIGGTSGRWMVREVRRLERQRQREYRKESLANVGEGI